jgi:hypothetical protein
MRLPGITGCIYLGINYSFIVHFVTPMKLVEDAVLSFWSIDATTHSIIVNGFIDVA